MNMDSIELLSTIVTIIGLCLPFAPARKKHMSVVKMIGILAGVPVPVGKGEEMLTLKIGWEK